MTHFKPSQSYGAAKSDIRENHLTTRKQNMACLKCDLSQARKHGDEMTKRVSLVLTYFISTFTQSYKQILLLHDFIRIGTEVMGLFSFSQASLKVVLMKHCVPSTYA